MEPQDYQRVVQVGVGAALDTEYQERQQQYQQERQQGQNNPVAPPLERVQDHQGQSPEEPSPSQEVGAPSERKIGSYADLTREQAEIVARLEAGEDLDAGEKKLRFFGDRNPTNGPEVGEEVGEPGEKRLRFFGELKQEHANATGKETDRSEGAEPEQGEPGEKKLHFFEDHNPSKGHSIEH